MLKKRERIVLQVRPLYERCKKLSALGKSFRVCTDQEEDGGTTSWTNPKAQTGHAVMLRTPTWVYVFLFAILGCP